MVEKIITALSGPKRKRLLDLDISAMLIVERLVGEILGWDQVGWSAVEPHKHRKFFFGRQRQGAPSIHDQLKPFFERCDPGTGDFAALKPSPIVNDSLAKLVGHLCRHVGEHHLPTPETDGVMLKRTVEQERLHHAVIDRLLRRIDDDPVLDERAARLKAIAAAAENELEKHFADLINEHIEKSFLPGGILDRYKHDSLRVQAGSRVEEACALNARELMGLAVPELLLDDDAWIRIEMTKILLGRFPYVRNYELMLFAELAMLQQPLLPRLAGACIFSSRAGPVDVEDTPSWRASQGSTVAICGSGSLPLSALFLHLFTGTKVILIDQAQAAVERSRRLINNLERLELLAPGALTVRQRNAGQVRFRSPGIPPKSTPDASSVACDAVMVASLVDPDAKAAIAEHFDRDPAAPELLIMRSATGLSARLAYDAVPTEAFSRDGLAYCGETVPATQIATHLDQEEATRSGLACTASANVLAIAHPDVVNTTEVYRRIPTAGNGSRGFSEE